MSIAEADAKEYIVDLYRFLLKRSPNDKELAHWIGVAVNGRSATELLRLFGKSKEYTSLKGVQTEYPPGHFYSPIVDPELVRNYVNRERANSINNLPGISIPADKMADFWISSKVALRSIPFPEEKDGKFRYYFNNGFFSYGDAISLWLQLAKHRPKCVIEIGSGYSSACMLDSADALGLQTKFQFIEPYPERLRSLLRESDSGRATLRQSNVQDVDLAIFSELEAGDILFIDSTHFLKTGSDVHFELCHVLPALKPGVLIHFHDIHYPFEYPDPWIFGTNKSWNEIYAIRLFLMYNHDFEISFWGHLFSKLNPAIIRDLCPVFLKNTGGSLWIRKL